MSITGALSGCFPCSSPGYKFVASLEPSRSGLCMCDAGSKYVGNATIDLNGELHGKTYNSGEIQVSKMLLYRLLPV
jgi:hypothetical protein